MSDRRKFDAHCRMMSTPSPFRLQMEQKARREAWEEYRKYKRMERSDFVAFHFALDKYQEEMEKA